MITDIVRDLATHGIVVGIKNAQTVSEVLKECPKPVTAERSGDTWTIVAS